MTKHNSHNPIINYAKPAYAHAHLPMLTSSDVPDTPLMRTLYKALRLRRSHETMTEARFVAWLCQTLPVTMIDGAGNIHVDLRTAPEHRTMFTAHTDTVHSNGGDNHIRLDSSDPARVLWRADTGACLGADDGAGIALMVHMIAAQVPGLYVFFRAEECGGLGSTYMADHFSNCLKSIDRCISFDRADQCDVITHQAGGRCCSDTFAQALADRLTTQDLTLAYFPNDGGVFTDSANLTGHIAECTNLSVGYKHQHGDGEYQDVTFLQRLADQLVLVPWDTLPTDRDPKAAYTDYTRTPYYDSAWSNGYDSAKWTDVPSRNDVDADVQYLADCLWDAAWGKYADLAWAVREYYDLQREEVSTDALKVHEMERLAEGLIAGTYDIDAVYEMLLSKMKLEN